MPAWRETLCTGLYDLKASAREAIAEADCVFYYLVVHLQSGGEMRARATKLKRPIARRWPLNDYDQCYDDFVLVIVPGNGAGGSRQHHNSKDGGSSYAKVGRGAPDDDDAGMPSH